MIYIYSSLRHHRHRRRSDETDPPPHRRPPLPYLLTTFHDPVYPRRTYAFVKGLSKSSVVDAAFFSTKHSAVVVFFSPPRRKRPDRPTAADATACKQRCRCRGSSTLGGVSKRSSHVPGRDGVTRVSHVHHTAAPRRISPSSPVVFARAISRCDRDL